MTVKTAKEGLYVFAFGVCIALGWHAGSWLWMLAVRVLP